MKKRGRGGIGGRILRCVLGAAVLAVLLGLFVMQGIPALFERHAKGSAENSASWMSGIPDEVSLEDINIPGAHDAAARNVPLAYFSKCQGGTVSQLLEDGYRYLDIRLGTEEGSETLTLMHGFVPCKKPGELFFGKDLELGDVLDSCVSFLRQNPTETILFAVKYEHGDLPVTEFQELLRKEMERTDTELWLFCTGMPTLGEARGRMVLLRQYEDEAGFGPASGLPLMWESQKANDDVSRTYEEGRENGAYRILVQDRYKYAAEDKWNAFTAGIGDNAVTAGDGTVFLNFLSTNGTPAYGHPWRYARELNARLLNYELPQRKTGWTMTDFGSAALAQKIYSTNFAP